MHEIAGIDLNLFPFLFIFSEIGKNVVRFLLDNKEIITTLAALVALVAVFIKFPYGKALNSFRKILGRFFQKNENHDPPLVCTMPHAIERKEMYDLRKAFKAKETKVIVITGDIKGGKTWLGDMFLNYILKKRIKFKKYSVMRYDLSTITSGEEFLNRVSSAFKEQGKERLHIHMSGEYGPDNVQQTLVSELDSTNSVLFLDNFDPDKNREVLDLINSAAKFCGKTKIIIVSPTTPEGFDHADIAYGIIKEVNIDCYNLAEVMDILQECGIRCSPEDALKIKKKTNGNPYWVAHFIYYVKKNDKSDLSNFDYMSIFEEPEVQDVEQKIINLRYRRVYQNLDEKTKIVSQILSALCFPCALEDLQNLYNQFLSETKMSDEYKKIRLETSLNDNFRYNLINMEDNTYFLDDSIKELIYLDFTLKERFHEYAQKYFEEKSSESAIYKEEYHFQMERYKEITEIRCPECGKTISKKSRTCKYCGVILTGYDDQTRIY